MGFDLVHEAVEIFSEVRDLVERSNCANISIRSHNNNRTFLLIYPIIFVSSTTVFAYRIDVINERPITSSKEKVHISKNPTHLVQCGLKNGGITLYVTFPLVIILKVNISNTLATFPA